MALFCFFSPQFCPSIVTLIKPGRTLSTGATSAVTAAATREASGGRIATGAGGSTPQLCAVLQQGRLSRHCAANKVGKPRSEGKPTLCNVWGNAMGKPGTVGFASESVTDLVQKYVVSENLGKRLFCEARWRKLKQLP